MVNFQQKIENGFDVDLIKNYNTCHGEINPINKGTTPRILFMKILLLLGRSKIPQNYQIHCAFLTKLLSFIRENGKIIDGKIMDGPNSIELCNDNYYHLTEYHIMLKNETNTMIMRKNESSSLINDQKLKISHVKTQEEADFVFDWMAKNQESMIHFEFPLIRFLYFQNKYPLKLI